MTGELVAECHELRIDFQVDDYAFDLSIVFDFLHLFFALQIGLQLLTGIKLT